MRNWLHGRDPERDALRRALRAALVIPLALAVGNNLIGGAQVSLFAVFGAFALLVFADFPGSRAARATAYAGLAVVGCVLITLGTLVSRTAWLAVLAMFTVGVLVLFAGVFSAALAAGGRGGAAHVRAAGRDTGATRGGRRPTAGLDGCGGAVCPGGAVSAPAAPARSPARPRRRDLCTALGDRARRLRSREGRAYAMAALQHELPRDGDAPGRAVGGQSRVGPRGRRPAVADGPDRRIRPGAQRRTGIGRAGDARRRSRAR